MTLISRLALTTVCSLAAISIVPAQPDTRTGYGNHFVPRLDLDAKSGDAFGIQQLNGLLYVTGRTDGQASVTVYDTAATRRSLFVPKADPGAAGWLDGASDGRSLLLGSSNGVFVMDTTGADVDVVIAANGPRRIANPIRSSDPTVGYRGVAYDPAGDGGNGSLWVGDRTGDLVELDLQGAILTRLANGLPATWDVRGLALDRNNGTGITLWASAGGDPARIAEFDAATGAATGNEIARAVGSAPPGGLCGVHGPHGYFGLLGLDRADPVCVTGYRVDLYGDLPGESVAVLLSGIESGPLSADTPKLASGVGQVLTIGFDLRGDPTLGARSTCTIANVARGANIDGFTGGFPEFVALHAGSSPRGTAVMVPSLLSARMHFVVPDHAWMPGDTIRVQSVYAEPRSAMGWVATNQVRWEIPAEPPQRKGTPGTKN